MKNIILKPIKYYLYTMFLFSIIVLINGAMMIDKPMYKITKGDNIRLGKSSKYEVVRTFKPEHFRKIFTESDKKGWQKIKTELFGVEISEPMYIWIDSDAAVNSTMSLGKNDFSTFLNLLIHSSEYFFSVINLKYDLDGYYDRNKDKNRETLFNILGIFLLSALVSFVLVPLIFIISIFRKKKKVLNNSSSDNSSVKKNSAIEENETHQSKLEQLDRNAVFYNAEKEVAKKYFSENFDKFTIKEIPNIKKILGIDPLYTLQVAINQNNYELFNTLIKIELIKQGEKK